MALRWRGNVTFHRVLKEKEVYNEETGNYEEHTVEIERMADVFDMSDETMELLFGGYKEDAFTVVVLTPIIGRVDYVMFQGNKYYVKRKKPRRRKEAYQVVRAK